MPKIAESVVRINLSLAPSILKVLDGLSQKEHTNRSRLVARLVEEEERRRRQEHINAVREYFADPECRAFEEQMAEEGMAAGTPLDSEEWPDASK